jgi:hypothetical protein
MEDKDLIEGLVVLVGYPIQFFGQVLSDILGLIVYILLYPVELVGALADPGTSSTT